MKKYKLGDICIFNAKTISRTENILIDYLETSNLIKGQITNVQSVCLLDAPSRAQRQVRHHTILYSLVRPNQKHYGILSFPQENLVVSTGFVTIDVKPEYHCTIDPLYLYAMLTQDDMTEHLQTIAEGAVSSYPALLPSDIANLEFDFPTFEIQRATSFFIDNLNRKIELNRAINHNLEAMAKQLYDYWFVQFDFPDENGRPYKSGGGKMVYNENTKRYIPKDWDDGIFADIANITMGQSPDGSSYNEEGVGSIFYQGSTDFGLRFPSVRMFTTFPSRFAKQGDILMSVRAPVGAVNIANTDCCIGRGLSAINPKIGSITYIYYVVYYLKVRFDNLNMAGTTFGSITKEELFNLPVVVPSDNVIERFDSICRPIFDKQMVIGAEIEYLAKQRDEILPLLMNGQVSVNYDLSHN